jgi:hypothetical protein
MNKIKSYSSFTRKRPAVCPLCILGEILDNWAIDELIGCMEEFVTENPLPETKYNYPAEEE